MTSDAKPRLQQRHIAPLLALTGAIILANAVAITGWYRDDPALFVSLLGIGVKHGPVPGFPNWLDPNIGTTAQALGHLSAQDWLHSVIPWWNPYQGVGTPLAAELQNGAFFLPFVLLLHFNAGWLLLRLLMQILAGLFTYTLLIELGLSRLSALLGGVMFACSATFILLADAPSNTLPFLPLLLLGIERARVFAITGRRLGWPLITVATAYSFYAGFPETGIIADAFGGTWFAIRLFDLDNAARWHLAGKFTLAVAIGLCLTLPGLLPFIQYIHLGSIGGHAQDFATAHLPLVGLTTEILPNAFGPFGLQHYMPAVLHDDSLRSLLNNALNAGGWIGLLPLSLGIAGLFSANRGLRHIRLLLLFWFLLFQARIFGVPGVADLLNLLPPIRLLEMRRYAEPTCDFAVILLAAMAFDHWQRHGFGERQMTMIIGLVTLILLNAIATSWPVFVAMKRALPTMAPTTDLYIIVMVCLTGLALYSLSQNAIRSRALFLGAIITFDAVTGFGLSQAAGASRGHLDLTGIAYLHRHLGLQRTYTLGPLSPNYGSRYNIAEINHYMLPVPKLWTSFVKDKLDPYANQIYFNGLDSDYSHGESIAARILRQNLKAYEAIGVAYVLANPGTMPLGPEVKPVFRAPAMWIFPLPHPAPYFSTQAADACDIAPHNRNAVTITCTQPTELTRRELLYPGWHAMVNDYPAPLAKADSIFQRIALAKGINRVQFFYRPEHERAACAIAILALLLWLGLIIRSAHGHVRRE